jgi:hypothetical protein
MSRPRSTRAGKPEAIPGKELNVPANSKLLIDGRPLTKAAATTERYHLIQQVASDGGVRASWIVLGNELPPNLLRDQQVTIADQRVEEEEAEGRAEDEASSGAILRCSPVGTPPTR